MGLGLSVSIFVCGTVRRSTFDRRLTFDVALSTAPFPPLLFALCRTSSVPAQFIKKMRT